MHEGRGYRYTFQRARVASSPEVPKVTWWKIATFLGYHLHWLTSLETSRHFRKIALWLGIFLAMFRECLCIDARQLAPKCHDFSNVAKLARQCKWPYCKWGLRNICNFPNESFIAWSLLDISIGILQCTIDACMQKHKLIGNKHVSARKIMLLYQKQNKKLQRIVKLHLQ